MLSSLQWGGLFLFPQRLTRSVLKQPDNKSLCDDAARVAMTWLLYRECLVLLHNFAL